MASGKSGVSATEESAVRIAGFGRAKSVIIVFASGGQSQIDMWDPKPAAPREVRGEFAAISTAIPGVAFCEHMPRLAKQADRFTVIRSMSHEDLDHGSAFYLSMTGRYHQRRSSNPLPSPNDFPTYGALLQHLRPSSHFAQTAVHLNGPAEVPLIIGAGQFGGFLGKKYDPFTLGDVASSEIAVPGLEQQATLPQSRLSQREQLLRSLDAHGRRLPKMALGSGLDDLYAQAFDMVADARTRDAFRLDQEPVELRQRYGLGRAGQSCLLARRLVEAGCPFVNVFWSHNNRGQDVHPDDVNAWGWDTHNDIFYGLKNYLLPNYDLGVSALLEDLDERGLLESTLVVLVGEFGRAPLVALEKNFAGASPGRKHWGWCYSIALAGAGVQRGAVIGASDPQGAYPASESFGPWDVMATVFHALGIDPHTHYHRPDGQQLRLTEGQVIPGLFG